MTDQATNTTATITDSLEAIHLEVGHLDPLADLLAHTLYLLEVDNAVMEGDRARFLDHVAKLRVLIRALQRSAKDLDHQVEEAIHQSFRRAPGMVAIPTSGNASPPKTQ